MVEISLNWQVGSDCTHPAVVDRMGTVAAGIVDTETGSGRAVDKGSALADRDSAAGRGAPAFAFPSRRVRK